jgi:urease accessory protein
MITRTALAITMPRGMADTVTRMGTTGTLTTMTMSTARALTGLATIPMSTDSARLMRLQSWLSPAFPIGAYSYSHGLERAVESGAVRNRTTLVDWLDADLRHGAGRVDGIFLAETWRAAHPVPPSPGPFASTPDTANAADTQTAAHCHILAIAELAAAMRGTAELALESGQQGIAFLGAVRKAWPDPALDRIAQALQQEKITPVLPVAAGLACAIHGIALEMALPLYLHAGVANLINAAVRLIPLGQSDGQLALAALETALVETAAEAQRSSLSEIGSAAFMIDIASMQHETQYTRLFRS